MKPTLLTTPFGRFYLLMMLFVGSCSLALAQNPTPSVCGTDELHRSRVATDSSYRNFVLKTKQQVADKVAAKAFDGTTYTIPVVFVVYHLGEAVGTGSNVSDANLQAQIDLMNRMYAANTATYPAPNARIQFVLARRGADCQAFSGILRVDGRSVPNYTSQGLIESRTQENQLRQLAGAYSTSNTDNFVVIRVVHNITFAGGYAYFGGDMFVQSAAMTSSDTYNNLLSHEMGHILFLDHTFKKSETSTPGSFTCPANANPAIDGDAVADTDPHKQNEPPTCGYGMPFLVTATNTCTGQPFGFIGNNIMAYGCYANQFTQGQIDRMRAFLATNNRNLGLSNYGMAPVANEAVTAATCNVTTVNSNSLGYSTGISWFRLGSTDRVSQDYAYYSGYYQNYACTDRTTVSAGTSYSFSIGVNSFPNTNYRRIYVDYNNDGSFDETTELVFSSATGVSSGNITIPNTATRNVYLRLRVVVDNGSASTPPTACLLPGNTTYGYGEIEDYAVLVESPACQVATAILSGSTTLTAGQSATLITTLTGTAPWSLTTSNGLTFSNIASNPFSFTVAPITTTTYSVVAVSNGCGAGTVSGNAVVTVGLGGCQPPTNFAAPITSATSATLAWEATPGATAYRVQIRPQGFTTWSLSFTTVTPSTRTGGWGSASTFEYQVQSICLGGNTSAFSGLQTFRTLCPVPILTVQGILSDAATFNWQDFGISAFSYQLQYRQTGATVWINAPAPITRPYTLMGLTATTTYEARIMTVCSAASTSTYSSEVFFSTTDCLNTASGLTNTGISTSAANLNWSGPNGTTYNLRWRPTGSTSWNDALGLTTRSYTLTGLTPNTPYDWQVALVCTASQSTNYSPTRSFTTLNTCVPSATIGGFQSIGDGATAILSVTLDGSPPWSITLSNGLVFSNITTTPFAFTVAPTTTTTYLLTSVNNACGTGTVSGSAVVTVTQAACSSMFSLRTGNWNDAATWSCNRLPVLGETVRVSLGHIVTIPASTTGFARTVQEYGRLVFGLGAKLQLGPGDITIGLMAYYPFTGNTNDGSGRGNNGTVSGATLTTDRAGAANTAYAFGGFTNPGSIQVSNNSSLTLNQEMTISLWMNLATYAGMDGYGNLSPYGLHCLLSKDGDRGGFWLALSGDATRDKANIYLANTPGAGTAGNPINADLPGNLSGNLNRWHHVAITVSASRATLFLNGVPLKSDLLTGPFDFSAVNTKNLHIGSFGFNQGYQNWYPFNGKLDEVRFYNRALTDTEVQALAAQ